MSRKEGRQDGKYKGRAGTKRKKGRVPSEDTKEEMTVGCQRRRKGRTEGRKGQSVREPPTVVLESASAQFSVVLKL